FNEWVTPYSKNQADLIRARYHQTPQQAVFSQEKVSLTLYEDGYLKKMIYAGALQGQTLKEVSLIEYQNGRFQKITFAEQALWLKKGLWRFESGYEHFFSADDQAALSRFNQ